MQENVAFLHNGSGVRSPGFVEDGSVAVSGVSAEDVQTPGVLTPQRVKKNSHQYVFLIMAYNVRWCKIRHKLGRFLGRPEFNVLIIAS